MKLKILKYIRIIASVTLIAFFMTSCAGKNFQSSKEILDKPVPVTNPAIQEYNQKLGDIKDQKSAEKAVSCFVNYTQSRLDLPQDTGVTPKSGLSSKAIVKSVYGKLNIASIASSELKVRSNQNLSIKGKIKIADADSENLISVDKFAEEINTQGTDYGLDVKPEHLAEVRDSVRESIPNITADKDNPNMTPLEAMTVAWAYGTGDTGTAATGSIKISEENVQEYSDIATDDPLSTQATVIYSGDPVSSIIVTVIFVIFVSNLQRIIKSVLDIFGIKTQDQITSISKDAYGRETGRSTTTDSYYGVSDLEKALSQMGPYVEFDNSNPPAEALASLPSYPYQYSSNDNIYNICKKRGNKIKALSWSKSSSAIAFPWDAKKSQLQKGDLIFSRGEGSLPVAITKASSWTHVAIFYDPLKDGGQTFESLLERGVDLYYPKREWGTAVTWSVKRVKSNSTAIPNVVEQATNKWAKVRGNNIPYFPSEKCSILAWNNWVIKWSQKDNLSSMYCSKLVWNTFKKLDGMDLDSNRTRFKYSAGASIPNNWYTGASDDVGRWVDRAWIGVSPDDVYYSKWLGQDIYLVGQENLCKPIATQ